MARNYFINLDGLRFLLALAVFSSHSMFGATLAGLSPFDFLDRLFLRFSSGSTAVSFFFVLSGFLITYLMLEEYEKTGKFDLKKFYIRRTLRIWPLYYFVLVFGFFVYPFFKSHLGFENNIPYSVAYQFLFLSNFDSIRVANEGLVDKAPMMIGITWSVAIEEQFYLLWPLLFLALKGRRFWPAVLVVVLVSWFCRTFVFRNEAMYYHTVAVASDLAIGAAFAMLVFYNPRFVNFIRTLRRSHIVTFYVLALLYFLYHDVLFSDFAETAFSRLLHTLIFALVIVEQSYAENSFFKFGRWPALSAMGKYSYSLYMLHPIGIQFAIVLFRYLQLDRASETAMSLLYVLVALIPSMLLSFLSYHYIERYFLNLKKKFYPVGA
jgi:peptidoglycan/LPS O-acetylase OafA/YrhL